ncbi:hypothetical protein [Amycolatopsis mediterranei]|uniref:hypothetical protein n=1 Tax=Amycolatopsis mediterranei TaxID=33910 RepID=UPI003F4DE740
MAVEGEVDLGGRSAPAPADGMVVSLAVPAAGALNNVPLITRRSSSRGRPFAPEGRRQRLDHLPLLISQLMPTHQQPKIKADPQHPL